MEIKIASGIVLGLLGAMLLMVFNSKRDTNSPVGNAVLGFIIGFIIGIIL